MSREKDPREGCGDRPTEGGCDRPPLERLRFWNGRFLVARDLRHQQDDLVRRMEYHQHFAHGEGILCGFRIRRHPREECDNDWLVVDPGMAYDCCGHTLWMDTPRAVRVPRGYGEGGGGGRGGCGDAGGGDGDRGGGGHAESHAQAKGGGRDAETGPWAVPLAVGEHAAPGEKDRENPRGNPGQGNPGHGNPGQGNPGQGKPGHGGLGQGGPGGEEPERLPDPEWFVVACRVECLTDPQPALYADDLCEPVKHEHGRVREEVELRVVRADAVSHACWPRWRPVTEADCETEFEDDCREGRGDTVPCDAGCACGECVVLAALWRDAQGRLRWDTTHRKVLVPPTELTRITGVNWPHGGELPLSRLQNEMDGRLVVRFSRRLRPAEGFRRGINPMTFEVSYLGQSGAWEQVLVPEEGDAGEATPRLSANGRCAVFAIPRPLFTGRYSIAGSWVRVRILGDFILDCHGRPVSAAHAGGDVNGRGSGNGVAGGTFESWFYVRDSKKEESR